MGSDDIGPNSSSPANYEENTLIAALCDLVERIWSHARSDDYDANSQWESSKCPLWSHLTAFHDFAAQKEEESHRKFSKQFDSDEHENNNAGLFISFSY